APSAERRPMPDRECGRGRRERRPRPEDGQQAAQDGSSPDDFLEPGVRRHGEPANDDRSSERSRERARKSPAGEKQKRRRAGGCAERRPRDAQVDGHAASRPMAIVYRADSLTPSSSRNSSVRRSKKAPRGTEATSRAAAARTMFWATWPASSRAKR